MVIVPPGGFAGFAQMTAASRRALSSPQRSSGRRRRSSKSATSRKRKGTRARKSSKRKLKFGSPAWRKKYMKK